MPIPETPQDTNPHPDIENSPTNFRDQELFEVEQSNQIGWGVSQENHSESDPVLIPETQDNSVNESDLDPESVHSPIPDTPQKPPHVNLLRKIENLTNFSTNKKNPGVMMKH